MLKKVAILAVGSLPVLLFLWYTYHFSSPFPNEDDIPAILAFVNRAFPFAPEAGRLLFVPFREHVILPTKLIAYCQVALTGQVDLKMMILLGNLFWVRLLWLLYHLAQQAQLPPLFFLPVPFVLFQVQFSETALWPMALWSNLIVVWLAVESLNLLISEKKEFWRFGLAFFLGLTATFSNGNGLLVLLIGFVVLVFQRAASKRLVSWGIASIAAVLFYQWAKSLGIPDDFYGVQKNPLKWLLGSMIFVGNYGDFISGSLKKVALGLGFTLVAALMVINWSQWKKPSYGTSFHFRMLVFFLFILATAGGVSILRTEPVGLDAMYLGRYRHYSALAVTLVYLSGMVYLHPKGQANWLFAGTMATSLVVGIFSYYRDWGYRYMDKQRFFTDAYNMQYNNTLYVEMPAPQEFARIFQETLTKKLLKGDLTSFASAQWPSSSKKLPLAPVTLNIDMSADTSRCAEVYTVKSTTPQFELTPNAKWFWALKSDQHTYLFPTTSLKNKPMQFFQLRTYFQSGFEGELALCQLPKGKYQLFLVHWTENKEAQFYATQQTIWL